MVSRGFGQPGEGGEGYTISWDFPRLDCRITLNITGSIAKQIVLSQGNLYQFLVIPLLEYPVLNWISWSTKNCSEAYLVTGSCLLNYISSYLVSAKWSFQIRFNFHISNSKWLTVTFYLWWTIVLWYSLKWWMVCYSIELLLPKRFDNGLILTKISSLFKSNQIHIIYMFIYYLQV